MILSRFAKNLGAFSLVLLFLCISAMTVAFAENADLTLLSNSKLMGVIEDAIGQGWTLYQPSPREVDTDTSSSSFLKKLSRYPIVARKGETTKLLLLEKSKKSWKVLATSDQALVRTDFQLIGFSVDENVQQVSSDLAVYFDFSDAAGTTYTLTLALYANVDPRFTSISYRTVQADQSAVSYAISLIDDRGFDFSVSYYDTGLLFSQQYSISAPSLAQTKVADFQLESCPLSILDLLTEAVCTADQSLYAIPDESSAPVAQVHSGDSLQAIRQSDAHDWTIIYSNGQVLFLPSQCIAYPNDSSSSSLVNHLKAAP